MNSRMTQRIDLATEVGESFAMPPCGLDLVFLSAHDLGGRRLHPRHTIARDDSMLLNLVTTGYVACGAHSGDAVIMGRTVRMLLERGISIGAHPSYPDIVGFGQASQDFADIELEDVILTQIASLSAVAQRAGAKVTTVKCHGALSFDVCYDERTAQVMARTISHFDRSIALVCMAGSPSVRVARDCGLRVIQEAYIDRGYDHTGRIVPRQHPRALNTDPAVAVAQFLDIVERGCVRTVDGDEIAFTADSLCLHSDTPNAGAIATAVGKALAAAPHILVQAAIDATGTNSPPNGGDP